MSSTLNTTGRSSFVPQLSMNNTTRTGRSSHYPNNNNRDLSNPISSLSSIHAANKDDGTRARSDSYKYGNWLTSNNNTSMSGTGNGGGIDTRSGTDPAHQTSLFGSWDGAGDRLDDGSPTPRRTDRTAVGGTHLGGWRGSVAEASNRDAWRAGRGEEGRLDGSRWNSQRAFGSDLLDDEAASRRVTIPRWRSPEARPSSARRGPDDRRGNHAENPNVYGGTSWGGQGSDDDGHGVRGSRWATTHVGPNRTYSGGRRADSMEGGRRWRDRGWEEGMVDSTERFSRERDAAVHRGGTYGRDGAPSLSSGTATTSDSTFGRSSSATHSSSSSDSSDSDGEDASSSSPSSSSSSSRSDNDSSRRNGNRRDKRRAFTDLRNFRPDGSSGFPFSNANGLVDDEDDRATIASMLTNDIDLDATPVVPDELLQRAQQPVFQWNRHSSHAIVLMLLQHRGIYLPRYRELINYHMAELFLHYLDACREGSYFVYYAADKWPKERFFRIRMLPLHRMATKSEPIPQLVITMHQSGVAIVDAIPLDFLVGVTTTPRAPCFRPFLESPNTILGCREGRGHRARLPVDGCFSLWFYDRNSRAARSVDLLTCDPKVYDIWTKAFMGIVSVNSSSVVQIGIDPGTSAAAAGAGGEDGASGGNPHNSTELGGSRSTVLTANIGNPHAADADSGSANEARMAELTRAAQQQLEIDMAAKEKQRGSKKKKKPSKKSTTE